MSFVLYLVVLLLVALIAYTSAAGAPWVPARKHDVEQLLDDAGLRRGEVFVELGCGDGRMLRAASARGAKVIGYELNPLLWLWARLRTVHRSDVRVRWGNFWQADIGQADVVMVFLVPRTMPRLSNKARAEMRSGSRLISYIFPAVDLSQVKKGASWYIYKIAQKK